jgi:hypothetical protein
MFPPDLFGVSSVKRIPIMKTFVSIGMLALLVIFSRPVQAQQPAQQLPQLPSVQSELQGKVEEQKKGETLPFGDYKNPKLFPPVIQPGSYPPQEEKEKKIFAPGGKPAVEPQIPTGDSFKDSFLPKRVPLVAPRVPTAADLKTPEGEQIPPTEVWSMTMVQTEGSPLCSRDITWTLESGNFKLHRYWNIWLSRLMLVIYQDCSRFKCPKDSDHVCDVHIRRDGDVMVYVDPGGDVAATLFRNAVMRLQGQQILDFPSETRQNNIEFKLNLHYGKPQPHSCIFKDAFGQPDARYPLEKAYW